MGTRDARWQAEHSQHPCIGRARKRQTGRRRNDQPEMSSRGHVVDDGGRVSARDTNMLHAVLGYRPTVSVVVTLDAPVLVAGLTEPTIATGDKYTFRLWPITLDGLAVKAHAMTVANPRQWLETIELISPAALKDLVTDRVVVRLPWKHLA